jgi:hypothetical protein
MAEDDFDETKEKRLDDIDEYFKEQERKEWLHNQFKRYGLKSNSESSSKPKSKKSKSKSEQVEEVTKKKKYVRKYTYNGTRPLFECVIIGGLPKFVCYARKNGDYSLQPFKYLEGPGEYDLHPAESADSQNPIPYTFDSMEELKQFIEAAKGETFETLFSTVKSTFQKYVNAEDYYITILSADTIYSYFQDKFGTTHYNAFVGDNGSGKNSALLTFKYLGYRVFYIVGASAPNYFTFLGDMEECQGSIAEDEAEDMAYNWDKNKVIRTGYCSGSTVPKVDLTFGRKQDAWLTYCHKWFAMEEIPDYSRIKGILDRTFVHNFVVGRVPYNIKDVIRPSGDSVYEGLYKELAYIRKLLFAFRLLHYDDQIPDIKLNVIHRNEELTKPLLRLFSYRNDAPLALNEIRLALSKFVLGRNESRKNSIESKLLEAIKELMEARKDPSDKRFEGLDELEFTNELIFGRVRELMSGVDIPGKTKSFYSEEHGEVSHKKITGLYTSKLKAKGVVKRIGDATVRVLRFNQEWLDRFELYYNVPTEIQFVTDVTDVTHLGGKERVNNDVSESQDTQNHAQIASDIGNYNDVKDPPIPPESVTSVTSVTGENDSVTSDMVHRCPYGCDYDSTSRFDYRSHLCNNHGMEWENTK